MHRSEANRDSGFPYSDFAGRGVVVCDDNADRCAVLVEELNSVPNLRVGAGLPRNGQAPDAFYLVGLANPPCEADLERLRGLKEAGCAIVAAYLDDARLLSLGSRCRVVLEGAPIVLDSSAADFQREIVRTVAEALRQQDQRLQEEEQTLRVMRECAIIGQSASMLEVFRLVQRVSRFSELPVLITGETGTGKELLAQAIYRQDPKRCHGPLVPFNCAAVNRELSESELFGHRKGAFTGADRNRLGLFRAAENGVLFLDEIGELDMALQAKLLRVLQENRVLAVGEDQQTSVNVRVLAATNRDLLKMVAAGTFREDLYHRLNVISVHIPPLRERTDDIEPLVNYFVKKHASLSVTMEEISVEPAFVDALRRASLPGNIRQLENLVRRAVIHCNGSHSIGIKDLPVELSTEVLSKCNGCTVPPRMPPRPVTAPDTTFLEAVMRRNDYKLSDCIDELEGALVQAVLTKCNGNQAHAARILGITPRSIYNKLKKIRQAPAIEKSASA